jgi:hypothetical protein
MGNGAVVIFSCTWTNGEMTKTRPPPLVQAFGIENDRAVSLAQVHIMQGYIATETDLIRYFR